MKKDRYGVLLILLFFTILAVSFSGCFGSEEDKITRMRLVMDTHVTVTMYGISESEGDAIAKEAFAEMERLEGIFSRHIEGSDIEHINRAAGREWVEVAPEAILVIEEALAISRLTEGVFDPTVAPLLEVWGFGNEEDEQRRPSSEEIEEALLQVDYEKVEINEEESSVFLAKEGMQLDLGGIAKGFIVDRGQKVIEESGVEGSFVNAGGDINITGSKTDGEPWKIAVQDPRDPQKWFATLQIDQGSVATSGDYQRFFEEDGERYHHIIDPESGWPADGGIISVTVLGPDTLAADAYSTAVFVLGIERGLELLETLSDMEGVLIDKEGDIHYTSGLDEKLEIL